MKLLAFSDGKPKTPHPSLLLSPATKEICKALGVKDATVEQSTRVKLILANLILDVDIARDVRGEPK